jgi:hypothetical protein
MVRRRILMENQREQKGLDIAKLSNQIKRIDADTSQSNLKLITMNTKCSKFLENGSVNALTMFIVM